MKKIIFLGYLLATSSLIHATDITRASILQTALVPFLEAEDESIQLQSTHEVLVETESILESTQEELSQTESLLESTQDLLSDTEQLLQTTESRLDVTESVLESTQEELTSSNSIIDEADSLISGTSISDASALDAMISTLFDYEPLIINNPVTDPLVQDVNNGLLPYLQAALAKIGAVSTIKQIAEGATHTLILMNNGNVYTCGSNTNGQLGIGNNLTDQKTLTLMHAPSNGWNGLPLNLAAGDSFSLVVTSSGIIYGCGLNTSGQLGIGNDLTDQTTLTPMLPPTDGWNGLPTLLSAGQSHSLVVTQNGVIYGCGNNSDGQLGIGSSGDIRSTLTAMNLALVNGTPSTLVARSNHPMILMGNGNIYGCGMNIDGPLGIGTTDSPQMTLTGMDKTPLGALTPSALAAGDGHTLVLTTNGTLYGCGWNAQGQLGLGADFTDQLTLTLLHAPITGFSGTPTAVTAGSQYSLVLTNNGVVYGCGQNTNGQLGIGVMSNRDTLTAMNLIPLGYALPSASSAGVATTLILATDGRVYGCGTNANGELGIGNDLTNQATLTAMHNMMRPLNGPVRITV